MIKGKKQTAKVIVQLIEHGFTNGDLKKEKNRIFY